MPTQSRKPLVYISYSHADEPDTNARGKIKWLSFVISFLQPATKHGVFEISTDRVMTGGAEWNREIEGKLRDCDIFILLVSPNSMASTWIVEKDIAIIRERQASGEAVYFYPLLLQPTPTVALDLVRDKNLRPRDGKPLSAYKRADRERVMAEAADEITKMAEKLAVREEELAAMSPPTMAPEQKSVSDTVMAAGSFEPSLRSKTAPQGSPADGVSGFNPDSTASAYGPDVLETNADARALSRLMCLEGAAPLAIAVFGGWGSGKSSFMERLDREVREIVRPGILRGESTAGPKQARIVERVVQIRFNAWQFVDANLWASITAEFFAQLRAGGWEGQTDASYAGLVERVTRHVRALNVDLEGKRKIASDSALKTAEAQMSRDQAETEAKDGGRRVLERAALDDLWALYDSERGNLSALGLEVAGDDTTRSVEAVLEAISTSRSISRQLLLVASMFLKDPRRLWTTLAITCMLVTAGILILWFGHWSYFVAALSWIAAAGTLAAGLMPALRFVNSVARRGAEIAQKVDKADAAATAKLLQSEIKLRETAKETKALEAAAEEASKRLARYVDPQTPTNPPHLLRYVLEDDPDSQALESQMGLIGRTRRLFQAIDAIAQKEREKVPSDRDKSVPDRVIMYIDDLDRCSEEQVYNALQAIHLLLAFELFVVVVGIDVVRVQTALAKLAAVLGQEGVPGQSRGERTTQYLEKIFQIAFWLSPLTIAGGNNGSYARFVRSLTAPPAEPSDAEQTAPQTPAEQSTASDAVAPSGPEVRTVGDTFDAGFVTIALEQEEVDFLASDAIGRLAAKTPRGVKRLLNCYQLVRTRLADNGAAITSADGESPLYPLVALTVALDTGQPAETTRSFYEVLSKSTPTSSLEEMVSQLGVGENASAPVSETLKKSLDEVISGQSSALKVADLQRVAAITRRFSFNEPN